MDKWTEGERVNSKRIKKEKPYNLWFIYHSLGSICLLVFLEVSDLSNMILGTEAGLTPGKASLVAGYNAYFSIVAVMLGYYISTITLSIINKYDNQKLRIIFIVLSPVLFFVVTTGMAYIVRLLVK